MTNPDLRRANWHIASCMTLCLTACALESPRPTADEILGSWQAESYRLKTGEEHVVVGHIFFDTSRWTVLFFVVDDEGSTRRGSAEGGIYRLADDELGLSHHFNLSWGEDMPGLPAASARMTAISPSDAAMEPCLVEIEGNRLTLRFPSGNSMTFSR